MRRTVLACGALAALLLCPGVASANLTVRGSAEQVQVTGVNARARVLLFDTSGRRVGSKRADSLGGAVFRGVKPGRGYRVRTGVALSRQFTVISTRSAPP